VNQLVLSGTETLVLSGTLISSYQEHFQGISYCTEIEIRAPNLSNRESNLFFWGQAPVENDLRACFSNAETRSETGSAVGVIPSAIPLIEEAAP